MSDLQYNDYIQRISIQDVLRDAGYVHFRPDGVRYPAYVRYDSNGQRVSGDKFFVSGGGKCCFQPPVMFNYNIISFIKEHPQYFAEYTPGMSPDRLVNLVCHRLLSIPEEVRRVKRVEPRQPLARFDLGQYEVTRYDPDDPKSRRSFYPFFKLRGIDAGTKEAFREYFYLTRKKSGEERPYTDLAFPLTIPGQNGTVGLELRSMPARDGSTFKGKAAGSNGSQGLWIASPSGIELKETEHVIWFESAFDAMAYWQLHRTEETVRKSVFISTGGSVTESQMRGVIREAVKAEHRLCFDNDQAGETYVARFQEVLVKEDMKLERATRDRPEMGFKDWNDQLVGRRQYHEDDDLVFSQDYDGNVIYDVDVDFIEEKIDDDEEEETHKRSRGR